MLLIYVYIIYHEYLNKYDIQVSRGQVSIYVRCVLGLRSILDGRKKGIFRLWHQIFGASRL